MLAVNLLLTEYRTYFVLLISETVAAKFVTSNDCWRIKQSRLMKNVMTRCKLSLLLTVKLQGF